MASRQKKSIKRQSLEGKKSKTTLRKDSNSNVNDNSPKRNADQPEVRESELLKSLLSYVTTDCKIINSFAKLSFRNSNSYFGWMHPTTGLNGYGTYKFENGTFFKGAFEGSLTRGLGRYIYKNGDMYEGELLAGRRHGYGRYITQQFRYEGCFHNGKFHGQGLWKSKSKEVKGVFHDGVIKQGKTHEYNGIFIGNFNQSGSRKSGRFFFRNGDSYNGSWSDNLFSGFGVYKWHSLESKSTKADMSYKGFWLNGKRHGLGKLTFKHRLVLCQWSCDRKSGTGVILACNSICYASENLFSENEYLESRRIKNCKESRDIFLEALNLIHKNDTGDERNKLFVTNIAKLISSYGDLISSVNPIRIPNYEIPILSASGMYSFLWELKQVQQVLVENYCDFEDLFKKYTHLSDESMNYLGLNLFYMDIFHKTHDISIYKCIKAGFEKINNRKIFSNFELEIHPLTAVPFYDFFQHFVHVTEVLMENTELRSRAEQIRPQFFSNLAIRILLVLKMLKLKDDTMFLVREGIMVNRPAILKIILLLDNVSNGDKSSRAVLRYLNKEDHRIKINTGFFEHNDNVFMELFCKTEEELSELELVELVLQACQHLL